jgi:radical SAM protein with 4Fe4S-binding SPASM domain
MNKRVNPFYKFIRKDAFLKPLEYPLNEFPFYVDIELTNDCNIDCIMCKRQIMTREIGYMQEDIYRKIIDEMSIYDAGLRYCRNGEPTLHKKITEFIAYANEKKVVNYLSTNGFYSREKMMKILRSRPDIIRFSFQGLEASVFEKFRQPSKYDVVMKNIFLCARERDRLSWDRPYLIISTTVLDEGQDEINAFRKEWLEVVDRVEVGKTTFSWVKHKDRYKDEQSRVTVQRNYIPCLELLTKISINWNGDITACCGDYNNYMIIGNVKEMSIKEAWESGTEKIFREMVSYDTRHAELPLCKDCFKGDYKFKDNPVK